MDHRVKHGGTRRGRAALVWALVWFASAQALLSAAVEFGDPLLRDPEFGNRLARLEQQLADAPDAPLLMVLGSSRAANGVQPAAIGPLTAGPRPLVFNFAMTGYGPIQELQLFERLSRRGVLPAWLLIEVHPLLLHSNNCGWGEEAWIHAERLDRHDLSLLDGYLPDAAEWRRRWLGLHLAPSYWYRFQLLAYCAPSWLDFESRQDGAFSQIDPLGWSPLADPRLAKTTWADRARQAREHYAPALPDFDISAAPDRALRTLIAAAQRRGIEVGLLLMPEGDSFRTLYTAEARRTIADYLSGLSRECSVPVFDATTWCSESCFADGHHLLPDGSAEFSRRLGREVIAPLVSRTIAARRQARVERPRR
jgi:hypothetical protein